MPRPLSRPWGPAWAVPLAVVWPLVLGDRLLGGAGPLEFGGLLLGASLWVALPFLAVGAVDAWRPVHGFRAVALGGAVATALAWAPLYYVAVLALLGEPLGFWAPAAYPALASPLCAAFGMAVGAALGPGPDRYEP